MRTVQALAVIGFAAALAGALAGDRTLTLWALGITVGACLLGLIVKDD